MKKYLLAILLTFVSVSLILAEKKDRHDNFDKVRQAYFRDKLKTDSLPPFVKASYIDSMYAAAPYNRIEHLQEKGKVYFRAGLYREAIPPYNEIAGEKDNVSISDYMDAVWRLAFSHNAIGRYEEALNNIYLMITTPKPDSLDYYDVEADFMLGHIYELMGNKSKRDDYLEAARKKLDNLKCDTPHQQNLKYRYHLEKASTYLAQDDWNNAFSEDSIAMTYAMDPESAQMVNFDMALLYDKAGFPDQAEAYFKKYISESSSSINRVYALHNYALFLLKQSRFKEAKDLCLNQIRYTETNGIDHVKGSLWDILSQIYRNEGDYENAYAALRRSNEILDSIFEWKNNSSITEVTKQFEDNLKLFEKERLIKENRTKNIIIAGTIMILAVIALLSFILWRQLKRRKLRNMELEEKLSEQREKNRENTESLSSELDSNKRELLTMSMQLSESDNLISELKQISYDSMKSGSEILKELKGKLRTSNVNGDNWEMFKSYFDKIHPHFFTLLFDRHPDLTAGEARMCAYILLNLSAKEIANLTNRSQRTVESMKYRLHKKLRLGPEKSTLSYLHSIEGEFLLRKQNSNEE